PRAGTSSPPASLPAAPGNAGVADGLTALGAAQGPQQRAGARPTSGAATPAVPPTESAGSGHAPPAPSAAWSTMSVGSGDKASAEGDSVWLQALTAPNEGEWFYGQEGLPPGLIIDSSSGVIQGTIAYNAAEVQGGIYPVTVTATSLASGTISQSF